VNLNVTWNRFLALAVSSDFMLFAMSQELPTNLAKSFL
jgi:hypothetical protein